jgi:flagellar biosynthesis chaperone FliJ
MVNAAPREVVIDLRHKSEDASRLLYERTIDDRNALEAKISALEKENRELRSRVDRKIYR